MGYETEEGRVIGSVALTVPHVSPPHLKSVLHISVVWLHPSFPSPSDSLVWWMLNIYLDEEQKHRPICTSCDFSFFVQAETTVDHIL